MNESKEMPWASPGLSAPCAGAEVIDLSSVDYVPTSHPVRFIYVGGGAPGDVKVDMANPANGTGIVFKTVPIGTFMPLRVSKVYKTGTTATNLLALW